LNKEGGKIIGESLENLINLKELNLKIFYNNLTENGCIDLGEHLKSLKNL
jgi:hypothetical protein